MLVTMKVVGFDGCVGVTHTGGDCNAHTHSWRYFKKTGHQPIQIWQQLAAVYTAAHFASTFREEVASDEGVTLVERH